MKIEIISLFWDILIEVSVGQVGSLGSLEKATNQVLSLGEEMLVVIYIEFSFWFYWLNPNHLVIFFIAYLQYPGNEYMAWITGT